MPVRTKRYAPGSHFPTALLAEHFRDNWTQAGATIRALPEEEQRMLYLSVEEAAVQAHRKWFQNDCRRPAAWWRWSSPEPRDPDQFECVQLREMGVLEATELGYYPAALLAVEERFRRALEWLEIESAHHAKTGHWRSTGGPPWTPYRGHF